MGIPVVNRGVQISAEAPPSALWSVHLEVGFLGHMLASHLIFWGTALLSSLEVALFYILTDNAGVPAPPHPLQHLFFRCLVVAILIGVKGIFVVLFCNSLIIGNIEHLFMWWLAIYVSLKK